MLNVAKHRSIMLDVLKSIYEDSLLGPILGFKGGTLLYIQYNLNRFSVDLDFDLLDPEKEALVLPRLKKILKNIGSFEEQTSKKYTIFTLLNYEKGQRNLKIEISKRNLGSKYKISNYLGIPIQTMVEKDIFANKLIALTTRRESVNRDVFDTWFLLKNRFDINWDLIKSRTQMDKDQYIKKCIECLENWPLKHVLNGLGELVDNKTKDWIKKNLIKDTIFLLKANHQL
ncbi:MAG: nucleotidyl transferase AbiEii/AbiGii toxin family protein [bacterium]|nr:MAG: nucleotidyl transferase AbiEii/AbiGii toxin family protein [bacterium]